VLRFFFEGKKQSPCGAEGEEARLRRGLWCTPFEHPNDALLE
jgi:hypothetical protein